LSSKRNRNKKAWAKARKTAASSRTREPAARQIAERPVPSPKPVVLPRQPSELDQIGVLIVEEQLGLATTDLEGLRVMVAQLPFEPCISLLSMLAGRVEKTINRPLEQLVLAEEFFGPSELLERYRRLVAADEQAHVFGPQPLYTLMRMLVEDAYDAPITQDLTADERLLLLSSVVSSNSVVESDTDLSVGPTAEALLAYELQAGGYYTRPRWMEELARARELYRLATEDPTLARSPDYQPVDEWIDRSGLTADEQWQLGFALSALASAWDPTRHPHVPAATVSELLRRATLTDREPQAVAVVSADRAELRLAFEELKADGRRFIWELRPFNRWPFLRLEDGGGLLLLGRPWMLSWLGEGFHYRAMRVAQHEDTARTAGRTDHVQRYTAYAGQVFEAYCLRLARDAMGGTTLVVGERQYGKGGGQKTSDVAILVGEDLILFEANARRIGAEPLVTGDPLDATNELTKLLVKKINQLGVCVGALLDGAAELEGVDMHAVKRVFPVVVAAGHVWQTGNLWTYLEGARDDGKCSSFNDPRVKPLQVLDAGDYEMLMALAAHGSGLGEMLARKTNGPFCQRDLAVWLSEDPEAPDRNVRLPAVDATFKAMTAELTAWFTKPE
jgi:hypothetical protein